MKNILKGWVVGCLEKLVCCFVLMSICLYIICEQSFFLYFKYLPILCWLLKNWVSFLLSYVKMKYVKHFVCQVTYEALDKCQPFLLMKLELVWRYLTSVASDFKKVGELLCDFFLYLKVKRHCFGQYRTDGHQLGVISGVRSMPRPQKRQDPGRGAGCHLLLLKNPLFPLSWHLQARFMPFSPRYGT